MSYKGKKVYTSSDFRYSKAKVGDYVTQDVVSGTAFNFLPTTTATFVHVADEIWEYRGRCRES